MAPMPLQKRSYILFFARALMAIQARHHQVILSCSTFLLGAKLKW